jgi:hypothetical protein
MLDNPCMLFPKRFWGPIRSGEMTLTFRRWKRRQVVGGNHYRTAAGMLRVISVDVVAAGDITDAEARRAGHPSAEALVAELRGTAELPIYRIAFELLDGPDPREVLAADAELGPDDVAEIDRRLDRLDAASRHGPWTRQTLEAIARHPHRRAADLAAMLERGTPPFKTDVRKLKNLGLTLSFDPGYSLSPRGEAYLRAGGRLD